jgi:signal transduction histidine kinase
VGPVPGQLATDKYQANTVLSALFFLALLARRRYPAAAIIVTCVGHVVLAALPPHSADSVLVFAQILVLPAIAGTMLPEWVAWTGWAGTEAIIAATEVTGQPRSDYGWSDFFLTSGFASVLFFAAFLVSRRTRSHRQMAERTRVAEQSAAEAVSAERTRITREMHDVVAHSLTVAVVQCVSAADDLERGAPDLASVGRRVRAAEGACRDALDELRRMLGVLRFGAEPLAPTPRITELPDLARSIGATGLRVELSLDGDLDGLPPGVELSCYRIVQEALTNTLKHSGARSARVNVSGQADDVRLCVCDDGPDAPVIGRVGGQGLIGMRERAAAYGGTLSAGPDPGGGYVVEAVLPRGERR